MKKRKKKKRMTHCKSGHLMTGSNVTWSSTRNGRVRCCRECKNRRARERYRENDAWRAEKIRKTKDWQERRKNTSPTGTGCSAADTAELETGRQPLSGGVLDSTEEETTHG